jgi:hypothetical protein
MVLENVTLYYYIKVYINKFPYICYWNVFWKSSNFPLSNECMCYITLNVFLGIPCSLNSLQKNPNVFIIHEEDCYAT